MSYLRGPRLVFSGRFQADPSTVNNDPEHFDSANFQPGYQQPQGDQPNGWWNPDGTGAWRLADCVVTGVVYADGSTASDATADPIIGATLAANTGGDDARIVDLDSEHQMTSQIWGLKLFLGDATRGFSGGYDVASFLDLYSRAVGGDASDIAAGAAFQSVLEPIQWSGAGGSRFLQELSAHGNPTRLSIKFNLDGYDMTPGTNNFTFGRIVGAIGPQLAGEPAHFVAGRALDPVGNSAMMSAYAEIAGGTLTIDLGNSLQTQTPGGPIANVGPLNLVILQPPGTPAVTIGPIPSTNADWYAKTAGIVSFSLSDVQRQAAAAGRLAVVPAGGGDPFLAESSDGTWVRADETVFRLSPGDTAKTTYYATVFGARKSGVTIRFGYDPTILQQETSPGPIAGPQTVGLPITAFTFPPSVTTVADGTAVLTVTAADPGNPRGYIDGQVYAVTYGAGGAPPPTGSVQNASRLLNALVWSRYVASAHPTWTNDVKPILQQYANLYPVMKPYVDLSNYNDVVAKAVLIQQVFGLPTTDASYMPVTRDLSPAKKAMILAWLNNPVQ
jgi:hypothetical protein